VPQILLAIIVAEGIFLKRDEQKFKVEIIRTVNKAVNSKNDEKQLSSDYLTDMSISYIHQSPTAEGVVGEFLC
jgi:hypothetical protein